MWPAAHQSLLEAPQPVAHPTLIKGPSPLPLGQLHPPRIRPPPPPPCLPSQLFYTVHALGFPLFVLFALMHYQSMVYYMAPGEGEGVHGVRPRLHGTR